MIRTASAGDVAAIVAIERECFGASAWSEGLVSDEIVSDRHVVLLTDDGAAYGAISLAGDVADLDRIAVMPTARGQGLARAVLADLVDRARDLDAERMLLEVAADNTAATALYASCGFDVISTRVAYYPGGIDAWVMELGISEWR